LTAAASLLACSSLARPETVELHIEITPASRSEADRISAVAFGTALAAWVSKNQRDVERLSGYYDPSFEAILGATQSQAKILSELKASQRLRSAHVDALVLVYEKGYLTEYVWHHFGPAGAGDPPDGIDLAGYRDWAKKTIPRHKPGIEARVRYEPTT